MSLILECDVFLFLKEIPPDVVCDINRDCANTFIKCLLEKQKWPEVLLLLTGKVSGEPPLGDGLIKDCSFSSLFSHPRGLKTRAQPGTQPWLPGFEP